MKGMGLAVIPDPANPRARNECKLVNTVVKLSNRNNLHRYVKC